MRTEKEEQELIILGELNKTEQILGSGVLKEALRQAGMELSEATVGRLLRDMDNKGYTKRVGFQGRKLTTKGMERLEHLEREQQRVFYGSELLKSLNTQKKQDLIDILIARRAVEGEIARLAAQHATAAEIDQMRQVLELQSKLVNSGQTGVEQDTEFHVMLAKAGKNRILYAVVHLIRQEGQFSPVLEYIRQQLRGAMVKDHQLILEAIEQRQLQQAYEAMVNHIEGLISDVERYWEQISKE